MVGVVSFSSLKARGKGGRGLAKALWEVAPKGKVRTFESLRPLSVESSHPNHSYREALVLPHPLEGFRGRANGVAVSCTKQRGLLWC